MESISADVIADPNIKKTKNRLTLIKEHTKPAIAIPFPGACLRNDITAKTIPIIPKTNDK